MKMHRKIMLLAVALLVTAPLSAQDNFYKFHALFIYNFAKHIQWPEKDGTFIVGVYGSDIAMKVLDENIKGRLVSGRPILVRRVSGPGDVSGCNIIYAPKSNRAHIAEVIEASGRDILTVTEDDMLEVGACISFVIRGTRLNFKISKSNIEQQGLKVGAALLSLGERVD